MKYFNISIHDVTSSSLSQVEQISKLLNELHIEKPTYLVIPKYHGKDDIIAHAKKLKSIIGNHEIAMHGYTHKSKPVWKFSYKKLFSENEGEFAEETDLMTRISLGLDILRKTNLEPKGFIPPAWLIRNNSIKLFYNSCFAFLNTRSYIYDLRNMRRYRSPVLTFSSRGILQKLSIITFKVMCFTFRNYNMIRIAIHPKDIEMTKKVNIIRDVVIYMKHEREEVYFSEFIKWDR